MKLFRSDAYYADFLDGLSASMQSGLPLLESMVIWSHTSTRSQRRLIDNFYNLLRQGTPLSIAVRSPDLSLPKYLQNELHSAIEHDALPEVVTILSQRLRRYSEQRIRLKLTWAYTLIMCVIAWCACFVIIQNMVPVIGESFESLMIKPAVWYPPYLWLYQNRWHWFIGIPSIFAICLLIRWMAGIRSRSRRQHINSPTGPFSTAADVLRLSSELTKRHSPKKAVAVAQHVIGANPETMQTFGLDLARWQNSDLSDVTGKHYLSHLTEMAIERERIHNQYWLETLPFRIHILVACSVLLVYFAIVILPISWYFLYGLHPFVAIVTLLS